MTQAHCASLAKQEPLQPTKILFNVVCKAFFLY